MPETQYALQIVGPDKLYLNKEKPVPISGNGVEALYVLACGLCFSDLKLLKQFGDHVRKQRVVAPWDSVLEGFSGYRPGTDPTVPGHEPAVLAVNSQGQSSIRLLQADLRWLMNEAGTNNALGYGLEGGLQEVIAMPKKIMISPEGELMYRDMDIAKHTAAEVALIEPWACVEQAYMSIERKTVRNGGRVLIVSESSESFDIKGLFKENAIPGEIYYHKAGQGAYIPKDFDGRSGQELMSLQTDLKFDDIIYVGNNGMTIQHLNDLQADRGIMAITTCGKDISSKVKIDVGSVHYRGTRIIGTLTNRVADAYSMIPTTTELPNSASFLVIGGAGPMGQMHVLRALMMTNYPQRLTITDIDGARLAELDRKAAGVRSLDQLCYNSVNTRTAQYEGKYDRIGIMAPLPPLVAQAVESANMGAIVDIFAGIPKQTPNERAKLPSDPRPDVDLNALIRNKLYLIGTSGSPMPAMDAVIRRVEAGTLNTLVSLDAVGGMIGAEDGIRYVEHRLLNGKAVVFPGFTNLPMLSLHKMDPGPFKAKGLQPIQYLGDVLPSVHANLNNGFWTKDAEREFFSWMTSFRQNNGG